MWAKIRAGGVEILADSGTMARFAPDGDDRLVASCDRGTSCQHWWVVVSPLK